MKKHVGDLIIKENDKRDFSQLEEVTGYLYVHSNVTLPQLTSVGGYLYVYSNVTLNIKFLKKLNYIVSDTKLFVIESKKTSKGITIYSGYNLNGIKNNKLVKQTTIYLASKDEFFAHGKTIKKAVEDLQFKLISEKLKKEPIKKDTILTIKYYRLLTGACELGVKEWMRSNKIEEGIKAIDLLPILEKTNAYGLSKFKQLISW